MPHAGVVFVHGLFSSRGVWDQFERLISADPELSNVEQLFFEYRTPKIRLSPARRVPDFNDLGDSLATFLRIEAAHLSDIALVSHSQGGLVVQRFLARTLAAGRGTDLARLRQIVLFACPNDGSEFALLLRRGMPSWLRNVQERDLSPLNAAMTEARRVVVNRVVHAKTKSPHEYPVPIQVYAGESDNIVKPQSAMSIFPDPGMLPGDHGGVVRPDSPAHRSYRALRSHLIGITGIVTSEEDHAPSGRWVHPVTANVRRAVTDGAKRIVLYGLPRTGKTTAIADARIADVEITTSDTQPDDDGAQHIAVQPLSRAESLSLLTHELDRRGLAADPEQLLNMLPRHVASLPGTLCAYAAEIRKSPPELLVRGALPDAVKAELAPIRRLIGNLAEVEAGVLARLCLLNATRFANAVDSGLVTDVDQPAIHRLVAQCAVTWTDGRIEVPAVVIDAVPQPAWQAAADWLTAHLRTAAQARLTATLASAVPAIAERAMDLGVFDRIDFSTLAESLNRQGHWAEYVTLTRLRIVAFDQVGDTRRATSQRFRLSRKVGQRGDLLMAAQLLTEAREAIDSHELTDLRAELHSHRAFLAHLRGHTEDALREVEAARGSQSIDDPTLAFILDKLAGNIQLSAGDHDAAAASYRAALAIEGTELGPRLEAEVSLAQCESRVLVERHASGAVDPGDRPEPGGGPDPGCRCRRAVRAGRTALPLPGPRDDEHQGSRRAPRHSSRQSGRGHRGERNARRRDRAAATRPGGHHSVVHFGVVHRQLGEEYAEGLTTTQDRQGH